MVAVHSAAGLTIVAAGATDSGPQRSHNEDAVLVRPDLQLYAVGDGAGGRNAGNVASAVGLMTLANSVESTRSDVARRPPRDEFGLFVSARSLSAAVHAASREVVTIAKSTQRSMGSTLCAALFDVRVGVVHVANVGDSRCYRLRGDVLELLTVDHTLLQDVLEVRPEVDDSYLRQLNREVATRALGMRSLRVDVRSHEVVPGDSYLLCSDGLRRALGDHALRQILIARLTPRDTVAELIRRAQAANADDNVAAVVIGCGLPPGGDFDSRPRPPPSPPAPVPTTSPEILFEHPEYAEESDPETDLCVLPPESASPEMLQAMGTLISHHHARTRTTRHDVCQNCREPVEVDAHFCPHCGARRLDR